jgi:hypothetical protein
VQLFHDEQLTVPVQQDKPIDFGEVWFLEAKTQTVWLYNEKNAFLRDIKVEVGLEQLVKVKAPSTLKAKEKGAVAFTWQPNILEGLKAEVRISAVEVYFA